MTPAPDDTRDAIARLRDRLAILADAFDTPVTAAWRREFDQLEEAEAMVTQTAPTKEDTL